MQGIRKELDKSNSDYKSMAEWKAHSHHSNKKRTEFAVETQPVIDNNPSWSRARDMGVSEFLFRQVVHEDIYYFSYKIIKGHFFFITGHEGQERRPYCKTFEQIQASLLCKYALVFVR